MRLNVVVKPHVQFCVRKKSCKSNELNFEYRLVKLVGLIRSTEEILEEIDDDEIGDITRQHSLIRKIVEGVSRRQPHRDKCDLPETRVILMNCDYIPAWEPKRVTSPYGQRRPQNALGVHKIKRRHITMRPAILTGQPINQHLVKRNTSEGSRVARCLRARPSRTPDFGRMDQFSCAKTSLTYRIKLATKCALFRGTHYQMFTTMRSLG
ncbi:hypothetical protein WA026_010604 [Henosepilachna vigintioctopunctata]|uniref:Uncharacterized protein n=1 Tax=Henosepilachna vigintioctopunctata TaxID=420089 RepID=A0AAW1V631_9CUCU